MFLSTNGHSAFAHGVRVRTFEGCFRRKVLARRDTARASQLQAQTAPHFAGGEWGLIRCGNGLFSKDYKARR